MEREIMMIFNSSCGFLFDVIVVVISIYGTKQI